MPKEVIRNAANNLWGPYRRSWVSSFRTFQPRVSWMAPEFFVLWADSFRSASQNFEKYLPATLGRSD